MTSKQTELWLHQEIKAEIINPKRSNPRSEIFLFLSYLNQLSFAKMRLVRPLDQSTWLYDSLYTLIASFLCFILVKINHCNMTFGIENKIEPQWVPIFQELLLCGAQDQLHAIDHIWIQYRKEIFSYVIPWETCICKQKLIRKKERKFLRSFNKVDLYI